MALQDKVILMTKVEDVLKPRMFANLLEEAIDKIGEELNSFDLKYTSTDALTADNLVESFIQAKQSEGKAESTLIRYKYALQRFLTACNVSPADVNAEHVRSYFSAEQERGISDGTIEGIRQIFNAFFGWLYIERLIKVNPMTNVGRMKCEQKVREEFSETDIERLNRNCKNIRDSAIIHFLLSTGCRISEACSLDRAQVYLDSGECLVLGKGKKYRTVYMDDVTVMILKEYLATRTDTHEALFLSRQNNRITPGTVRLMLKKLSEKAGVENVHPHRFRRTMITVLLNRGMALQEVSVVAGHNRIDTTMHYYSVNKNRIKNAYKRYSY